MISVIIPVYNAEQYLKEAIDSVFSQTFNNWELILVDDGSEDSSGIICDRAADSDSRVRVIHKKNGGISSARNAGLDIAEGTHIFFLDADDMVPPVTLEALSNIANRCRCDIVCSRLNKFYSSYSISFPSKLRKTIIPSYTSKVKVINKLNALKNILYQKNIDNSICGNLFDSKLWKGLRFREGIRYEDLDIVCPLFMKAERIGITSLPLYYYRQHPASYLHTFSLKRADVLGVTENITKYIDNHCPVLSRAAGSRQLSANFNILGLIAANRRKNNNIIDEKLTSEAESIADQCWLKIKELRGESLRNPSVRLKNKLAILITYAGGRTLFESLATLIYK